MCGAAYFNNNMFGCEVFKTWLLCIKAKILLGRFFYNYQTLQNDICCFKQEVEDTCCTICPTSGLDIECNLDGENPLCFTATPTNSTEGHTSLIEYSFGGSWMTYTDGACISPCNSYGIYFNEATNLLIGQVYTGFYWGGTGDTAEEVIASATFYEFDEPHTVVSAESLAALLNSFGLPGLFVIEQDQDDINVLHAVLITNCGETAGAAVILSSPDEALVLNYFTDYTCEQVQSSVPELECVEPIIYFRHTLTPSEPCCPAHISTYMIYDIIGCRCYKVKHIEEDIIYDYSDDCPSTTTTSTTTIDIPVTMVVVEQIKQIRSFDGYQAFVSYTGDTPTHARLRTTISNYDTGWQLYNDNFPLSMFDPTSLINAETIVFDVSFDGGATIASTDTVFVLKDVVNVLQGSSNLYDITAHPDFVQCLFSTPYILAEFKTSALVTTFSPNGTIGLNYTVDNVAGTTAVGCSYCCVTVPPPIVKYYVVVIINVLP